MPNGSCGVLGSTAMSKVLQMEFTPAPGSTLGWERPFLRGERKLHVVVANVLVPDVVPVRWMIPGRTAAP